MDLRAHLVPPSPGSYNDFKGKGFTVRIKEDDTISIILSPRGRVLIPTGIRIALPLGYEAQVRPRSGLALKNGITVLNSPGTVDSDYRGDIGVILYNASDRDFEVSNGDRIAQMIIAPYVQVALSLEIELDETKRGDGGFGHTGNK